MSKNNVIELFIAKSLGKDFHRQNILFNLKKYNILIINFPSIYNSLVFYCEMSGEQNKSKKSQT
jgi:hypothetical protein